MLDSAVDADIVDVTILRFSTGYIQFVEDTTGRGHISHAVNNQVRISLFVTVN